jgi:hypothetical protein
MTGRDVLFIALLLIAAAGYCGFAVAVGRHLRHVSRHYPPYDQNRDNP